VRLLVFIIGVRHAVTTEGVAITPIDLYDMSRESFLVHRHTHTPTNFLIFFMSLEIRTRLFNNDVIQSPFLQLLLRK
jgi:hypothetical protein